MPDQFGREIPPGSTIVERGTGRRVRIGYPREDWVPFLDGGTHGILPLDTISENWSLPEPPTWYDVINSDALL